MRHWLARRPYNNEGELSDQHDDPKAFSGNGVAALATFD